MIYKMRKRSAVSNVVASIMILGIMTSILGMIFTTYIPAWAQSIQYNHLSLVSRNFIDLKSNIDVQIVRDDVGVTMSSTISLGDDGGPVMGVGRNSGSLTFSSDNMPSSVFNKTKSTESYGKGRGMVMYASNNDRVDNKEYIFEHDAIIIEQGGLSTMKVEPNIYLTNTSGNIYLSYTATTFTGESASLSGTKSVVVSTTLISTQTIVYYNGGANGIKHVSLNLTTSHVEVWDLYFQDLCERSGLGALDYKITSGTNWIRLDIDDVYSLTATSAVVELRFLD
jgi:hypothetical protein